MAFTFKGGIHPDEQKNTRRTPIVPITPPGSVCIPMSQHIGICCEPCVKIGDLVDKGQIIGKVTEGLGCPVHASISGKVTKIEDMIWSKEHSVTAVTIENDFECRVSPSVKPYCGDIRTLGTEEIIDRVRNAGIAGLGGATFPTYAKIANAVGRIKGLIINCAECEPYITANHRLLLEHPEKVVGGIKILLKAFSLRTAVMAIENNKKDAVKAVAALPFDPEMIRICVLKTKYPQGDERQLIYALTGKEIPTGKLPVDVGYVVFNAETCAAIYTAFATGMPLTERIVTVDGDCVGSPGSVLVPLGTPISELLEYCQTDSSKIAKIIVGGPMMGKAVWSKDTPITKGSSAVLAFSEKALKSQMKKQTACIRCGKCLAACPMHLMPKEIYRAYIKGDLSKCKTLLAQSCVECGSCTYVCPAGLDLSQAIVSAKTKLRPKRVVSEAKPLAVDENSEKPLCDHTSKTQQEEK
ncbi:MAG: electron transport complex subunit RsxC [Clostridia bacterium]|nr:electron transport complex subunit RsxC [Clostridia bacterium]